MDSLYKDYAIVIFVVVAFLLKHKIVVTPNQLTEALGKLKENILETVKAQYASIDLVKGIKEDTSEIRQQVSDLYKYLLVQHENSQNK